MNHRQQYIDQQTKTCREEWFKNHKASLLLDRPEVQIISWQNPASWNYGCRFIIHRRWLCVVGDIGEATFEWSQDLTLEFLASLDFGYFMGKCEASREGSTFESFNSNIAELYRNDRIKELEATPADDKSETDDKELELLKENSQLAKDEWDQIARDYYDETSDAEGASQIADMGKVPSCHAIGMFTGLKMAIAQLKEGK